jgi:hypothetical protein
VTSKRYAEEPLTRGGGVGDGVGVGVVGTEVGVGISVGVAVGVRAGVRTWAFVCWPKKENLAEKKVPIATTRTTISTSPVTRNMRCFMLHLYFKNHQRK